MLSLHDNILVLNYLRRGSMVFPILSVNFYPDLVHINLLSRTIR